MIKILHIQPPEDPSLTLRKTPNVQTLLVGQVLKWVFFTLPSYLLASSLAPVIIAPADKWLWHIWGGLISSDDKLSPAPANAMKLIWIFYLFSTCGLSGFFFLCPFCLLSPAPPPNTRVSSEKLMAAQRGPTLSAIWGGNRRCKRLVRIIHLANSARSCNAVWGENLCNITIATLTITFTLTVSLWQCSFNDAPIVWMLVLSSVMETGVLTKAKTYVN